MLEEKTITENLKIENGKAYAVFSSEEERRQLDGCQFRSELQIKITEKQNEYAEISEKQTQVRKELTQLLDQDNKLAAAGFCKLDRPEFDKIDGFPKKDENGDFIIKGYTHNEYCSHKGD